MSRVEGRTVALRETAARFGHQILAFSGDHLGLDKGGPEGGVPAQEASLAERADGTRPAGTVGLGGNGEGAIAEDARVVEPVLLVPGHPEIGDNCSGVGRTALDGPH